MKPSKSILKKAHWLCSTFKVKLTLEKGLLKEWGISGHAIPHKNAIFVDSDLHIVEFTTTLFHEIQHCLNYRSRKYFNYHKGNASNKELRRLGLRAEIYTDKEAKKLAKSFGFNGYIRTYKNNKFYRNYFKERYP